MAPASSTHCATCGWPFTGARCDACGGDAVPLPLEDAARRFELRAPGLETRGLEKAVEAWHKEDHARAISHCLAALGGASRAVSFTEGPAWIVTDATTALFVALRGAELSVESPVVRLPHRQRVPALRLALELCAEVSATARWCLRGDLMLLRLTARVEALNAPTLVSLLRDVQVETERHAELFASAFDARAAVRPEILANVGWDVVGEPRVLEPLAAPGAVSSPGSVRVRGPASSGVRHTPVPDAHPATTTSRSFAPPRPEAPTSAIGRIPSLRPPSFEPRDETIPAILSPAFAVNAGSKRKPTLTEMKLDLGGRKQSISIAPVSESGSDAERLCELLRGAQGLATALSYQEKPATMMLVVRSAVYRAMYEFGEGAAADAVTHLYGATAASTREIWKSTPEPRRKSSMSMPVPLAEPALLVMERIVTARAQLPRERAVPIEPLTTASQAKEHLQHYVQEIERAPSEPALRHFLALGALAELLVRTKLPQQTHQRVKDIVAHARRDGHTAQSIELMMTALARISGGTT